MIGLAVSIVLGVVLTLLIVVASSLRVVKQYERGVVFRFGRVEAPPRTPGLAVILPGAERMRRSACRSSPCRCRRRTESLATTSRCESMRSSTSGWSIPSGRRSTSQDYLSAIGQVAQTSLRSIIGKSDLDDLLTNREDSTRAWK